MGIVNELAKDLDAERRSGRLAADLAKLDAEPIPEPVIDKAGWTSGSGWELHIGTVQLFIVGPGSGQMWPVSESNYSGQVGTDAEREAARQTVAELNRKHSRDAAITNPQMIEILAQYQQP